MWRLPLGSHGAVEYTQQSSSSNPPLHCLTLSLPMDALMSFGSPQNSRGLSFSACHLWVSHANYAASDERSYENDWRKVSSASAASMSKGNLDQCEQLHANKDVYSHNIHQRVDQKVDACLRGSCVVGFDGGKCCFIAVHLDSGFNRGPPLLECSRRHGSE
jgi:hypothetical protein